MPVKYSGSNANYLSQSASPLSASYTIMCWARANSKPTNNAYYGIWRHVAGNLDGSGEFINSGGTLKVSSYDGSTETLSAAVNTGIWYHLAWIRTSATAWSLYINGVLDGAGPSGSVTWTAGAFNLGCWDTNTDVSDATFADFRIWDGYAMSVAELVTEMRSPAPAARLDKLWAWWPLYNGIPIRTLDFSLNRRNLTLTGTLLDDTPPPQPVLLASERYWWMPAFGTTGPADYPRSFASSIAHSAATARALALGRPVASSISPAATVARLKAAPRAISSSAAHSASLARAGAFGRPVASSVAHTAVLARAGAFARTLTASAAHSAAVARLAALGRALSASAAHSAALGRAGVFGRSLASSVASSAAVARAGAFVRTLASSIANTITLDGVKSGAAAYTRTIASTIAHAATVARQTAAGRAVSSAVSHAAGLARTAANTRTLAASAAHSAAVARLKDAVRAITATAAHTASLARQTAAGRVISAAISAVVDLAISIQAIRARFILRPMGAPAGRLRASQTRSRLRGQQTDRTKP